MVKGQSILNITVLLSQKAPNRSYFTQRKKKRKKTEQNPTPPNVIAAVRSQPTHFMARE